MGISFSSKLELDVENLPILLPDSANQTLPEASMAMPVGLLLAGMLSCPAHSVSGCRSCRGVLREPDSITGIDSDTPRLAIVRGDDS